MPRMDDKPKAEDKHEDEKPVVLDKMFGRDKDTEKASEPPKEYTVEATHGDPVPVPEPVPEGHISRSEVVQMIDEILHDNTFKDAEGRRRLADLSKRLSAKSSAPAAGVYDQSIGR